MKEKGLIYSQIVEFSSQTYLTIIEIDQKNTHNYDSLNNFFLHAIGLNTSSVEYFPAKTGLYLRISPNFHIHDDRSSLNFHSRRERVFHPALLQKKEMFFHKVRPENISRIKQ